MFGFTKSEVMKHAGSGAVHVKTTFILGDMYEGWNFNSGNYLFTTDTKQIHVSKFYCPSL